MHLKRWAKYLEVSSNLAVLVVAMILSAAIISTRWWPRSGNANFEEGLQRGQAFSRLPSVEYGAAPQTILIFLSTKCSYCEESLPFYKRLLTEHIDGKPTRIVAVFSNPTAEVEMYKQQNEIDLESIAGVNYGSLNISATPTLILVDSTGRVLNFWVGKLSKDEEQQVIDVVRPHQDGKDLL